MIPGSIAAGNAAVLLVILIIFDYFRCTNEEGCTAYKFSGVEERNCVLINENSMRKTFSPSAEGHLYMKGQS